MAKAFCPMCHKACGRHPENKSFPFCSPRCKLADLGNWLDARYALPDESTALSEDESDPDRSPPTLH